MILKCYVSYILQCEDKIHCKEVGVIFGLSCEQM